MPACRCNNYINTPLLLGHVESNSIVIVQPWQFWLALTKASAYHVVGLNNKVGLNPTCIVLNVSKRYLIALNSMVGLYHRVGLDNVVGQGHLKCVLKVSYSRGRGLKHGWGLIHGRPRGRLRSRSGLRLLTPSRMFDATRQLGIPRVCHFQPALKTLLIVSLYRVIMTLLKFFIIEVDIFGALL
jgi:hypothetical protein